MNFSFKTPTFEARSLRVRTASDLEVIVATIANSPVVTRPAVLASLLSDWENARKSPDVDAIVLAWIASHVPRRKPASLS